MRWSLLLLLPHADLKSVHAKRASVSSVDELWTFFVFVNTCVFVPVVLYFLVMLTRDPASKELVSLVWTFVKQKTLGFLSPASTIKHRRPLVAQQPKPKPATSRRKRQAF